MMHKLMDVVVSQEVGRILMKTIEIDDAYMEENVLSRRPDADSRTRHPLCLLWIVMRTMACVILS